MPARWARAVAPAALAHLLLQRPPRGGSLLTQLTEGARQVASACEDAPPATWQLPCASYGYLCADGEWGGQVRSHCPVTCGTCPATAAPGPACADAPPPTWTQPCSFYASFCSNPSYQALMTKHCRQTCGLCGGASGTVTWPTQTIGSTGRCKALSDNSNKLAQSLHVVLVPSGFGGDLAAFERAARKIYQVFSNYKPFDAENIDALQVWYVDAELGGGAELCVFGNEARGSIPGCPAVDRLLCCPGKDRLVEHAARHCGSGLIMNTLIVHNDERYGGAGFPWTATASVSVNENSAQIAIHELGHSLFGLGDEYTIGSGNADEDPNCDRFGCSKWSDLIGKWDVGCKPGKCGGGAWYSSEDTMMASFSWKFGEVNERISCCKYFYHTGSVPTYCQKFNHGGLDLTSYCTSTLWHGRYTNLGTVVTLLQRNGSSSRPLGEPESDPQGTPYVQVASPVAWTLRSVPPSAEAELGGEQWECVRSAEPVPAGLYLRETVQGDLAGAREHERLTGHGTVVVEVLGNGSRLVDRTIMFAVDRRVEVPFPVSGGDDDEDDEQQPVVYERRASMRVVLRSGEGCRVRPSARGGGAAAAE
ncbi:unnamed protein product [Prorocentrum cordatum]|uniref:ShKT domain-containing protein n=1 Tax=Prorocentrum cordatum TaxID=2364126 RepID=A0ABN9TEB2_9DINO|nr:unnamed protein product [Polarella glacialis]